MWWLNYTDRLGRIFGGMAAGVVITGVWRDSLRQALIGLGVLAVSVALSSLELDGRRSELSKLTQRSLVAYPLGSSLTAGGWGAYPFEPVLFWAGLVTLAAGLCATIYDEVTSYRRQRAEIARRFGDLP